MKITFIQTGGTIDKDLPKVSKGYAFEIGAPAVIKILGRIKPNFEYEIVPLLQKDSLDLNAKDREKILKACQNAKGNKIVVTHGTDTMTKTAKVLSKIKNKTIVFTGASRPEKFADSDAMFNVGAAIMAASLLPSGVYIAMNGKVHEWSKTRKDTKTGQFVEI
ncbi:MAG: asparaginase domain-containing protein [Candidatus Pacebacteria bacterium]|nr:asparaginase domain-containing protein [Candidatus Paceibacterota bacterium]